WNRHTGFLYRSIEVCRRDLCLRRDMAQVDADARHDAVFERILVDRCAAHAEMARRIDVRAAMVGHREKHHHIAVDVSGIDEGLLMRLPDAVDDWRLPWIAWRAVVEVAAEIDDAHLSSARGQLRWIMHCPPAALRLLQNWSASPADANGPVMAR